MTAFKTVTIQPEVIRAIYEPQKARLAEHYKAIEAFWEEDYSAMLKIDESALRLWEQERTKARKKDEDSKKNGIFPMHELQLTFLRPFALARKETPHKKLLLEIEAMLSACSHGTLELTHEQFIRMQSHERGEPVQKLIDEITEQKKEQA